jgi:hypothetical protein
MGGMGSGRTKTRNRELIENCQFLDIGFISKYGWTFYPIYAFIENEDDKEFLFLDYSINWFRLKLNFIDKMEIDKTNPYFGGQRRWIICNGCGKRVRKLYRPESKTFFKCRNCFDLMYKSQESNVYDGWLRKTSKRFGLKPKQLDNLIFNR